MRVTGRQPSTDGLTEVQALWNFNNIASLPGHMVEFWLRKSLLALHPWIGCEYHVGDSLWKSQEMMHCPLQISFASVLVLIEVLSMRWSRD